MDIEKYSNEEILKMVFFDIGDAFGRNSCLIISKKEVLDYLEELNLDEERIQHCCQELHCNDTFISTYKIIIRSMSNKDLLANYNLRDIAKITSHNTRFFKRKALLSMVEEFDLSNKDKEKCKMYLQEELQVCNGLDEYFILNNQKLSKEEKRIVKKRYKKSCREISRTRIREFLNYHMVGVAIGIVVIPPTLAVSTLLPYTLYKENRFAKTKIIYDDEEYNIGDVYAVYNANDVWYCTRKLANVTEEETTTGSFRYGNGTVQDIYYRDEIYEYLDIEEEGKKICQDHEENYYIEPVNSICSYDEVKDYDFCMELDTLKQEHNVDDLLSREPTPKIKCKKNY